MRPFFHPALLVLIAALAARLTAQPANVQADPTTGVLLRPSAATFISGNNLASATGGIVLGANGGTGVANTGKTLTLGGNVTTSGAFGLTLTLTAATGVTLPTSGTLSTLAGVETFTNKTLTSPTLTGLSSVATVGAVSLLTADGNFATSTGWTVGSNWTIGSGVAAHAAGATATLAGTTTVVAGTVYQLNFTLAGRTAGQLRANLGTNAVYTPNGWTANGATTAYVVASGNNVALSFVPTSDFDGNIDTVTLYALTPSTADATLYASNGDASPVEFRAVGSGLLSMGVGNFAAKNTTTGLTTAVGYGAAKSNVTGSVTAVGVNAGAHNVAGNGVFVGEEAGTNTSAGNATLVGHQAGYNNTTGVPVGVGYRALYSNTTGVATAVGDEAGYSNTTGFFTGVGYVMGRSNTTGNFTGFGHYTGYLSTTADFTGFGFTAGFSNTTGDFTGFGYEVGYSNTSGEFTGFGRKAGYANTSGQITAVGFEAGRWNTTGSLIALGYKAGTGAVSANAPVQDTYGILIGHQANRSVSSATVLTNYIGIGTAVSIDKSNQVKIGNTDIVETRLYGTVSVGTAAADNPTGMLDGAKIYIASGDTNALLYLDGNSGGNFLGFLSGTSAGNIGSLMTKYGARFATATAKDATGYAEIFRYDDTGLTVASGKRLVLPNSTPASASATGTAGTITWDSSYIYICTATNTWKRVSIATW